MKYKLDCLFGFGFLFLKMTQRACVRINESVAGLSTAIVRPPYEIDDALMKIWFYTIRVEIGRN
jgi:hypothetical protein